MILKIDPQITEKYPDLRIGVVVAKGVDNEATPAQLETIKLEAENNLRKQIALENLASHPHIDAWRQTYKSFGVKPKKHRPTAEALIRRILKGDSLPKISPIVDLYLANELDNLLPIGGYDLDKVDHFVSLEICNGGADFLPMGSSDFEKTQPGEVIYKDSLRILTRRWNYRDCDHTKITNKTTNFALFAEAALPQITNQALEKATKELQSALSILKHSEIKIFIFEPAKDGNACKF